MAAPRLEPHLVMADQSGNIYDDPQLLMVCRRGAQWGLPRPDELMPLPEESELFLLPGRRAVGVPADPAPGFNPDQVAAQQALRQLRHDQIFQKHAGKILMLLPGFHRERR